MFRLSRPVYNVISYGEIPIFRPFEKYQQYKLKKDLYKVVKLATNDIKSAIEFAQKEIFSVVDIHHANMHCNYLLAEDEEFRESTQSMLVTQMKRNTPHVTWGPLHTNHTPVAVFRSISINGEYGSPEFVFNMGMPAAIFNTRSGDSVLTEGKIVSYSPTKAANGELSVTPTIPDRPDMWGFTFGPHISTSLCVGHVIDQRFMPRSQRYMKENYIYLIALEDGFNTAYSIHHGTGFVRNREAGIMGIEGVSCQEDAREISAGTYIPKKRIMGARKLNPDGTLGPFIKNPNANINYIDHISDFVDVEIYFKAKTIEDVKHLEMIAHPGDHQYEDVRRRKITYTERNKYYNERINKECKSLQNGTSVSLLLESSVKSSNSFYCEESLTFFTQSITLVDRLKKGKLRDAKKEVFDVNKAQTKEDLKCRAETAAKLLDGNKEDLGNNDKITYRKDF